jgi:MFS family permease
MAPFYPLKAKEVGVDIINIGQVMGSMATISMIVSFLTGKIMHKKGL